MEDADGIDADCGVDYLQNGTTIYSRPDSAVTNYEGTGIWATSWLLPADISGNVSIEVSCIDWSGNVVNYSSVVIVAQPTDCLEDCEGVDDELNEATESPIRFYLGVGILLIVAITLLTIRARTRGKGGEEVESWHLEQAEPERDERIPEGWGLEEFLNWLDGPLPDDWEEEQWELYRSSLEDLR
jgi:hypothetical protein